MESFELVDCSIGGTNNESVLSIDCTLQELSFVENLSDEFTALLSLRWTVGVALFSRLKDERLNFFHLLRERINTNCGVLFCDGFEVSFR